MNLQIDFSPSQDSLVHWDPFLKTFLVNKKDITDLPLKVTINNIDSKKSITFIYVGNKIDQYSNIVHWVYKSISGSKFLVWLNIYNS